MSRVPSARIGLRTRATLAFGLLALVVSSIVGLASYALTRSTLVDQRQSVAERQTYVNARSVRAGLLADPDDPAGALDRAQTSSGGLGLVRVGTEWFSTSVSGGPSDVPRPLLAVLDGGAAGRQRIDASGGPAVVVAVPLGGTGADYVEVVPLGEVDRTLRRVGQGLAVAVLAATVSGVVSARWLGGRVLRPVRRAAAAATEIHEGQLDRRLEAERDPDLTPLVDAFNLMVDGLQTRIEREARFASDVSHELRSPLATIDAALSVARRRVADPAAVQALDVLGDEVARFRTLIVDLLEIARAEAGVAELVLEEVDPVALASEVLATSHRHGVEVAPDGWPGGPVRLDARRIGQALVNLLDNAEHHGGGPTRVTVSGDDERVRFLVDDAGPGVPDHEREHVFQRFARGRDVSGPGTGLGLALVAEHVRLHGGSTSVGEAPGGGARFVIDLPRVPR